MNRKTNPIRRPKAASAFLDPGASAPELHPRMAVKSKPPGQWRNTSRSCQGVLYSRFFGASPVASAQDHRTGRDPSAMDSRYHNGASP
jgi:hypothetical protein